MNAHKVLYGLIGPYSRTILIIEVLIVLGTVEVVLGNETRGDSEKSYKVNI